jgi:hypothetical protein
MIAASEMWSEVPIACMCCGDPTFMRCGPVSLCPNCVGARARAFANNEKLKIKKQRPSLRTCPADLRIDRASLFRFRKHLAKEQGQ